MLKVDAKFGAYVGGENRYADVEGVPLIDPADGTTWGSVHSSSEIALEAVRSAKEAFDSSGWARMNGLERGALMRRFADLVEEKSDEFQRLERLVTGKTFTATRGEAAYFAQVMRYFAGLAESRSGRHVDLDADSEARIVMEPLGVVAAITPYNGPLSLGSWKLAPALALGNTVVLKPPMEGPGSSLLMATLAVIAGIPRGVINVVPGGPDVATALVDHPDVAIVAFTGSTRTARLIAARVGSQLKRFVCEAGGKSAHIVFADADLDKALVSVVNGIFGNAGQSCVAGSRLLIEDSVADEFLRRLVAKVEGIRQGHPDLVQTQVGPVATERQLNTITRIVDAAIAEGAQVLTGGSRRPFSGPEGQGFYFEPTVLTGVSLNSEAWLEEIFGPVLVVKRFSNDGDAIALANSSEYGLAAGVWTNDIRRAHRVSRALEAGTVWVNTYRNIDVRVPFGGVKQSGYGRENGIEVLREFSQIKSIVTDHGSPDDPFKG